MKTVSFCLCLMLAGSTTATAQEFRALLSGKVVDPSAAAVVDAQIALTNVATGVRSTTLSAADGNFVLPQLPPGSYQLTVAAPGFRPYTRQGIELAVGDRASVDVQLEVGDVSSSVTVSAELTGVESNQSIMGQLMSNKNVAELPLNGRNVFMLVQLSAGVVFTQTNFAPGGSSGTRAYDLFGQFTVHGSRPNSNAFLLDGAPISSNGQASYDPLVDAIEEFKVIAPTHDASQGLTGGGVVSMTMKSGGNQFHGVLSHFIRNQIFDAVRTQENRVAAGRPDLAKFQHQFNDASAMVSGPVVKNRFFFLGSYEGFWDRVPRAVTSSVPTVPQRAGDFSQTFNASGQLMTIYDPLATRQSGSSFVRDAFPGNRIPAGRISTVAQNIMGYIPLPNVVTNPITNLNNFGAAPNVGRFAYNSWYMKFDYLWNEKHRTFFSETQNYGTNNSSFNGLPFDNPAANSSGLRQRNHYGATLDHVYAVTSTTVLDVRVGWDRYLQFLHQVADDIDGSGLGFKGRTGSFPQPRFPSITFTNYITLGNTGNDYTPYDTFSLVGDVSRTINRHFVRAGVRAGQVRVSMNTTGAWYGQFSFDPSWTQRDPQRSDSTSGNDMASFLLGYPASGYTDSNPQSTVENKFIGLYVQDDLRLTRRVTVNLGLRWDVQTAPTERFNRAIYTFDPNLTYPLGAAQAKGGLVFADNGHRQPWDTKFGGIQPRVGVAWQATPKMVWRAGYGLVYLSLNGDGGNAGVDQTGYSRRTPFVATTGGGVNSYIPGLPGTGTFENPFPTGILQPYGSLLGPKTQLGQAVSYQNRGYEVPRAHQFNVGFAYDLPWKSSLEISYVGSRTRQFPVAASGGAISIEERLKGFADPNYLNAAVPNPFAGAPELAGTSLAAANITRAQALSPFPQFSSVTRNGNSLGNVSYNGLEMRVQKRLSSGISITGNYTFSKTLQATAFREPQYTTVARALGDFDRTRHLSITALLDLPFGRTKLIGSHWSRPLDLVAGNWQYNIIFEHMNGTPTPMPDAIALGDPRLPDGKQSYNRWFNTCSLLANGNRSGCASPDEPVVWQQLKPNQLRTGSAYFPSIRNDWKPNINMSLFKIFPISERVRCEFRAEAFNAFNTPIYAAPNITVTSANFGVVVLDQQNFPRNMQFALRVRF